MNSRSLLLSLLSALLISPIPLRAETPAPLFEPATSTVGRELEIGDLLPDLAMQKEDATPIRLSDFRGHPLALTFIYTSCPSPTFCPLIRRNFDVTQKLLERLGIDKECHLLSISLDPQHDTPQVLAAYAKACEANPLTWTFAAGGDEDIRRVGKAVGLEYRWLDGRIEHNLRTVVLDRTGHIRHIFRGDSWTPQELAAELNSVASR